MDLMQVIEKTPVLKGTFIEDLFKVLQKGEFLDIPDSEITEREKVIGEMNNLEKALQTLIINYEKNSEKIRLELASVNRNHTPEKDAKMRRELNKCYSDFGLANKMLHGNIHARMNEGSDIQTRAGFKIVKILPRSSESNVTPSFEATLRKNVMSRQ